MARNDRRKRVVMIGGDLGYLVRFRGDLLTAMATAGYDVWVATPDPRENGASALERIGVSYRQVTLSRTGMNAARDVRDLRALASWFRELRPDVVFAYGAKPTVVGLGAAAAAGVRRRYAMLSGLGYAFIEDERVSLARVLARTAQTTLYRPVFAGCGRVIFHNEEDRDELVRRRVVARDKTTVVAGSGVDLDEFDASVAPTRPPRFLFVGRMLRSKGVEELVRAAAMLRAEAPEAEVHLVGSSDMNPDRPDDDLLNAAAARGDVVLHGQVDDVRPHLRACSAFVLPSYREGVPRSAVEALASGRTAIVADVPGCRDVVRPGRHGALVPVRDAAALGEALVAYARDPERIVREGAEARRTAESEFDVRYVTAAMMGALGLDSEDAFSAARGAAESAAESPVSREASRSPI